jgi:pimeloyl-ACP methyl ester carboxylesterase
MPDEKTFDTGAVTINYGECPASGPPLVLLHGAGGRWLSFTTVLPQLVEEWHVYALDHRGHGPSGRVPGAYRILDYAQDAVALVQNLAPEPACLWGQSLGANVSIAVAALAPESIRAVVLEEPGLELEDLSPAESFLRQMRALIGSGRSGDELLPDLADVTMEVPGIPDPVRLGDVRGEDYLRLTAECLSQLEPEVLDFVLAGRLTEGWDLEALLRRVSCPALLLQGEAALGGLEDQVAQRAVDLLMRGRRVKIQDAGHNVHQTQPEAALQAATQFLRST